MRSSLRFSLCAVILAVFAALIAPSAAFANEPAEGAVDALVFEQDIAVAQPLEADGLIPASSEGDPLVVSVNADENDADDLSNLNSEVSELDDSLEAVTDDLGEGQMRLASSEPSESVVYRAHVQNVGWQDWVQDGEMTGTSGEALRMEAVEFKLEGDYEGEIFCQAHVQNIGWQRLEGSSVGEEAAMIGTSGQSLRVEAFKFTIAGEVSRYYDIVYRAHVQNIGWQDWVQNGEMAGTSGQALRVEALQIMLVAKSAPTEESDGGPGVVYYTHVQNYGWQSQKASGEMAGTSGEALRMEAIVIYLDNAALDGTLSYRAHVQNVGWQDWVESGELAGTSGEALRMEAFQIVLTGEIASRYDVIYRAHVENVGWQPWVANGATSGTSGEAKRIEALCITLVRKGTFEIAEGTYLISRADDAELIASAKANGSFSTTWNPVAWEQKFYIRSEGSGTYSIQSVNTGLFLADNGSVLSQETFSSGKTNQLWSVSWDGGAIFKNAATGRVLSIASGSVSAKVSDPSSAIQHLTISDVQLIQDGTYLIKSATKNVAIDIAGASWLAGANALVYTPNGGGNQVFDVVLSRDGAYLITSTMTGKALDVASGSTANGTNVRQWWKNSADAQLWYASIDYDGALEFVNVASGRHLSSDGDGSAESNVVSSDATQASNRKWALEATTYTPDPVLARALDIAQYEWSSTDYLILVDLTNNRTVIFEWTSGEWEPIFNWTCSTGAPWSPTVLGDYEVTGKGYSFDGALGGEPYTCYYYTQFYGDYLFHSVPYHQGTWNVQDATLGESVSHGCVRLATENAKWIYDNIPYYTHVYTYY
ncbi:MAG: RICIN domain-containing protein [Eggerthellaceae bacterium]|nr:RICIN domain-containing protein [Eggerthellaceae bacterium]